MGVKYLTPQNVIFIHDKLIAKYGGMAGLRDLGLLESALSMPPQTFDGVELYQGFSSKAAAYLFYITKDHPFLDGNKRTACKSTLFFLERNGCTLQTDASNFEEMVVDIASNSLTKKDVLDWFSTRTMPSEPSAPDSLSPKLS